MTVDQMILSVFSISPRVEWEKKWIGSESDLRNKSRFSAGFKNAAIPCIRKKREDRRFLWHDRSGNSECMRQKLLRTRANWRVVSVLRLYLYKKHGAKPWSFIPTLPLESARCGRDGDCSNNKCCRGMAFRDAIIFQRSPPKYVKSVGQPTKRRFLTKTQLFWCIEWP